jgi:dihydroorotate dehydrogenase (fumarate)
MADISTSFMGIEMSSPIVVGACTLSNQIDNIKRAEDAGAGGLVIYSLFQEQTELEAMEVEEELLISSDHFAESLTYFPQMKHAGAREHIMWVEKARKEVKFPLFGSLNATSKGKWLEYAKQLENAGCDGLELNLYSLETDPAKPPDEIEQRSLDVVSEVKSSVSIPVSVKLSPWYTSVANFTAKVVKAGAAGVVLFNRFYQPTIDPDTEEIVLNLNLSTPEETRLPLRWIAILSGALDVDFAANTGIHSSKDVARQLLAGARVTQVVSTIYRNGIDHITAMNSALADWMDERDYETIEDFRGNMAKDKIQDPYTFERAQYISLLMTAHDPKAKYGLVYGSYPVEERPGRVSG